MKRIGLIVALIFALMGLAHGYFIATLFPTSTGGSATGTAVFTLDVDTVTCRLDVCGLPANQVLAFHIHEFGDLTLSNGNSAGSHFNPFNVAHGCFGERHVGDLGNITIGGDGCGSATVEVYQGSMEPSSSEAYILGRGIVVHSGADLCTGATGNAGGRLLYGVIGLGLSSSIPAPPSLEDLTLPTLIAVVRPTSDGSAYPNLKGFVTFTPVAEGIKVFAHIIGLNPDTEYPLHIHQYGELTNTSSVGGHFNPYGVGHACEGERHTGDMGNFMTSPLGVLASTFIITNATTDFQLPNSILGLAVVIHAQKDNCVEVSSAGSRIAFGTIGVKQPDSVLTAEVQFQSPSGYSGTATFVSVIGGVSLYMNINGLVAGNEYGVHIHKYGDVTKADGSSLGSHFNPTLVTHGCPEEDGTYEVGDFGNFKANVTGTNEIYMFSSLASLDQNSDNYIIGRGLAITAGPDSCNGADGGGGAKILFGAIGIKYNSPAPTVTGPSTVGNVNAVCVMKGINGSPGSTITGNITLTPHPSGGTYFYFYLSGFPSESDHAIHVHQYGDVTSAAGTNTGGHFNPNNAPHACPPTANRHVGDLGTFTSNEAGKVYALFRNELGFLSPNSPASLIGRAIVVHSTADDCVANFGTRIAQCTIGYTSYATRYDPTPTSEPPASSGASVASLSFAAVAVAVVALWNKL